MNRWFSAPGLADMIEFFANAKVIAGMTVSFVANRKMVITKDVFPTTFQLPTEGLVGFTDLSAKAMSEMKMRFSGTDVSFRPPNKKKEMKVEYRLLHDIVAKALCAKSGSFDVITSKKFDLMVAISSSLQVNWGHILFKTLIAMVDTPSKQSQEFAVQLSLLLEKVVKPDLGKSVKLHALKVLNNKSVLTYMRKNQAVVRLAGERSYCKEKIVNEKAMEKKQATVVVVRNPVVVESQAAPEKSKSGTSSDEDSCPLSKLRIVKKGGATPKRKLVLDSSDSESTVSLPLVQIAKKQRTKRIKLPKQTSDDQAESNPGLAPDIPAEAEDVSTSAAPESNVEPTKAAKVQAVNRSVLLWKSTGLHISCPKIDPTDNGKGTLEAFARSNLVEEHCLLVLNLAWEEVSSKRTQYDDWALFRTEHRAHEEEQPALEDEETARNEQQVQEQIEEISRIVDNVDGAEADGSVEHEAHDEKEHQAQAAKQPAHEEEHWAQEEERPAQGDEQQAQSNMLKKNQLKRKSNQLSNRFKLVLPHQVQMVRYTADRENNSEDEEDFAQAVDIVRDTQTYMKHESEISRRALYKKIDQVAANINYSQTALETSLVRQFTEHQLQIANHLDFVKLQLAELVNHFKEIRDAKKGGRTKQ
ncbi:hypothetical protein F511_33353 [Dorcoceras hygrometricum]|uniref:Uncharacterized protein n=1 Tax=Dorcoceras hygrometricum TaxID=472368 RepID=A0A2Z7B7G1_9LAMI|nr:hypothetical protein F511_33353 [Dorcoceras hygrometricum]